MFTRSNGYWEAYRRFSRDFSGGLSRLGFVSIKSHLSNKGARASQKWVTRIILSNRNIFYHDALAALEFQRLELRLCDPILRFGKMLVSNPAPFYILPPEAPTVSRTRQKLKRVPVGARTNRYNNSLVLVLHNYKIVQNNMLCSSTSNLAT